MSAASPESAPTPRFRRPPTAEARVPPEARGLARDEVRLLAATPEGVTHTTARALPDLLHPGDLVVVNTSATLPAAVDLPDGRAVHVSTRLDDSRWVVEVRRRDGAGPAPPSTGEVLRLPGGQRLRVEGPHPPDQSRLWRAVPLPAVERAAYLGRHGRPIRYAYLDGDWPLASLQNAYADRPGSAEMASAGRPVTARVLVRLLARGVVVAPVVLHTGVSSPEGREPPQPEEYTVPAATARLVASTRSAGRRVVAVGTTVVRALESAADADGRVVPSTGWTDLVLGARRPARAVGGLLTGLHEAEASHLDLLEAVAGRDLVDTAYDAVTGPSPGYLWHEYGDAMLLLP